MITFALLRKTIFINEPEPASPTTYIYIYISSKTYWE